MNVYVVMKDCGTSHEAEFHVDSVFSDYELAQEWVKTIDSDAYYDVWVDTYELDRP